MSIIHYSFIDSFTPSSNRNLLSTSIYWIPCSLLGNKDKEMTRSSFQDLTGCSGEDGQVSKSWPCLRARPLLTALAELREDQGRSNLFSPLGLWRFQRLKTIGLDLKNKWEKASKALPYVRSLSSLLPIHWSKSTNYLGNKDNEWNSLSICTSHLGFI